MFDFACCFDVENDIKNFVRARRKVEVPHIHDAANCQDNQDVKVTIIGQERNGEILFTWDDSPPFGKCDNDVVVTYIGLFDQTTKTNSVLFIHEHKVCIVGCSINQERTLIAFTTLENVDFVHDNTSLPVTNIFRAFLAEVQPQDRVFSLNVERRNLLRCQFLYSKFKGFSETSSKETHMLFFLHKESIGQYRISLARMGDKGVVMSGQPRTKQIAKRFLWAQWDASTQRLYYLQRKKRRNSHHGSQGEDVLLTCLEFKDHNYETVLNLALTLPMPSEPSWYSCQSTFLGYHVTDESLNMQIITQGGGSLCICYQHPIQYVRTKTKKPILRLKGDDDDDWLDLSEKSVVDVNYSVLMLHHGYILQCCIPKVPSHLAKHIKLQFISLNNYILVYVPGYVAHLLNVSSELEPCHHITLATSDITQPWETKPGLPASVQSSHQLVGFLYEKTLLKQGDCILDCLSGKAYKISLNKASIFNMFKNCHLITTRISLLHLIVIHIKDMDLIRQVVVEICSDIMSFETPELLAELLVASTYNAMRRQLDKEVMTFLPFTRADIFRGQLEKSITGQQLARFTYSPKKKLIEGITSKSAVRGLLPNWPEGAADKRERRHPEGEFWDNIRGHLILLSKEQNRRFNTTCIKNEMEAYERRAAELMSLNMKGIPESKSVSKVPRRSYSLPAINKRAKLKDSIITVPFLQKQSEMESNQAFRGELLVEKLASHLSRHLRRETKMKAYNIATEYVGCQLRQSKQLLQMIWTVLGYENEDGDVTGLTSLRTRKATEQDLTLYNIFERYLYATEELCYPIPSGFLTLLTILGYNCHDNHTFLNHVDAGVFQLNDEFLALFLEELKEEDDDDSQSVRMKFQIIKKLPKEAMMTALKSWNHPIATRYLSQQYVSDVLIHNKEDGQLQDEWEKVQTGSLSEYMSSVNLTDSLQSSMEDESLCSSFEVLPAAFPPLTTLIRLLESKEALLSARTRPRRVQNIDHRYIEENALHYTMEQCGENLSHVTF
ncbi:gamma-secretase-activating protein-like [Glandiceps talaboti]